jgi:hypothetical protein
MSYGGGRTVPAALLTPRELAAVTTAWRRAARRIRGGGTIGLASAHTEALLAVGYRVTYGFMLALSLAGVFASLASKRVHHHLHGGSSPHIGDSP